PFRTGGASRRWSGVYSRPGANQRGDDRIGRDRRLLGHAARGGGADAGPQCRIRGDLRDRLPGRPDHRSRPCARRGGRRRGHRPGGAAARAPERRAARERGLRPGVTVTPEERNERAVPEGEGQLAWEARLGPRVGIVAAVGALLVIVSFVMQLPLLRNSKNEA